MSRNLQHDLQLQVSAEEGARQRFALGFKRSLEKLRPSLKNWYQQEVEPELPAAADRLDIARCLYKKSLYCSLSALRRSAQEVMWQAVADPIERQQDQLSQKFNQYSHAESQGSLELTPALELPKTMASVHVHLQPGGYCQDKSEQDLLAGALYEAGGALYSQGQAVGTKESKADLVIRKLAELYPDFTPASVLDMACSAGSSSIPYRLVFPDAEVHGIDIAPAMLRFAHAKAESLGAAVHFKQRNVTETLYPDKSFDLVVSHNALHEMSQQTQGDMFAESYRLLKPGGICVHQDVPLRFKSLEPFLQAEYSYDQWFNAEPFWSDYAGNDCLAAMKAAGFDNAYEDFWVQSDNTMRWYVVVARKPQEEVS